MYCNHCGSKIDDKAEICPNCGTIQIQSQDGNSFSGEQSDNSQNQIPPQYKYQTVYSENLPKDSKKSFAIASLILSISGIIGCCCGQFGILSAVLGLIFGIAGLKSDKRNLALAGIIIGAVMIVLSVSSIFVLHYLQNSADFKNYIQDFYNNIQN